MDNRSPNMRQDAVTQAAGFFMEFRAGDGTPAVRARFEKWLRASPENVQAYLDIAAGWSALPTADPEGRIDVQALLVAARDTNDANVIHFAFAQADIERRSLPHRMRAWAVAASLAALVTLVGTALWVFTKGGSTYNTGIGEQRTLILADGSTVTLNALTTVRVRMSQSAREVALVRGQAYFHDTDDPDRPFIVRIGKSTVRAIGTEFDVDKESDRTVVTVLEGRVAVAAKSFASIDSIARRELLQDLAGPANPLKAVLVSAGEQVTVLAKNVPVPKAIDVGTVTAWMQQRLVFDDTPLESVAQQFNLYSKRRLVISDPSLRSVGVSGVYSASDPIALIGFLRSQPMLRVVETSDEFLVTRR